MRISDWSSDVCASDLPSTGWTCPGAASSPHSAVNTTSDITRGLVSANRSRQSAGSLISPLVRLWVISNLEPLICVDRNISVRPELVEGPFFSSGAVRSEEHPSELQSLMRTSYAVFCLQNNHNQNT